MSKFIAVLSLSAAIALPALPAFAGDHETEWLSRAFRTEQPERRSQSVERRASSEKKAARAENAPAKERKVRVASASDSDNDSRPQRKAASKPRPNDGLSGDSGQSGVASFYHEPQALASGGRFNPNALTAAHRTLPFGTRVRVTHAANGRSVDVVINDRGPYAGGRIIDLSKRAASEINMINSGVAKVRVAVLGRG